MLIGILSDSHDRADAMAAAMRMLQARSAHFLLHCGDLGSPAMLDHLAGVPSAFVWGNCDYDRMELQRYAEKIGVSCYGNIGDLTLDGKRFALIHGDDRRLRDRLIASSEYDYICQGHTHIHADQKFGRTRLINPGALHRARPKTIALLNTATDALEFFVIS